MITWNVNYIESSNEKNLLIETIINKAYLSFGNPCNLVRSIYADWI